MMMRSRRIGVTEKVKAATTTNIKYSIIPTPTGSSRSTSTSTTSSLTIVMAMPFLLLQQQRRHYQHQQHNNAAVLRLLGITKPASSASSPPYYSPRQQHPPMGLDFSFLHVYKDWYQRYMHWVAQAQQRYQHVMQQQQYMIQKERREEPGAGEMQKEQHQNQLQIHSSSHSRAVYEHHQSTISEDSGLVKPRSSFHNRSFQDMMAPRRSHFSPSTFLSSSTRVSPQNFSSPSSHGLHPKKSKNSQTNGLFSPVVKLQMEKPTKSFSKPSFLTKPSSSSFSKQVHSSGQQFDYQDIRSSPNIHGGTSSHHSSHTPMYPPPSHQHHYPSWHQQQPVAALVDPSTLTRGSQDLNSVQQQVDYRSSTQQLRDQHHFEEFANRYVLRKKRRELFKDYFPIFLVLLFIVPDNIERLLAEQSQREILQTVERKKKLEEERKRSSTAEGKQQEGGSKNKNKGIK